MTQPGEDAENIEGFDHAGFDRLNSANRTWCVASVWFGMSLYILYVSYHTILHHYSFGTSAYDLGIMENVFWNSVNGNLFGSSIEAAGNHLGVHTSFIFFLFFPLYALIPRPETLLVLQTVVLALAAWPLFLLAEAMLRDSRKALLVSVIYLVHPAVGGANFYDFHELAFTPICLFSALFFLRRDRLVLYWVSIALLLSVKEDMTLVVVCLGIVLTGSKRFKVGLATILVGAAAFVVLQYLVIPHFAGGQTDYGWYYEDLGGERGGIGGIITTVLRHPIFAIRFALTPPKLLYIFQIFAPLAFLTFTSWRGAVLVSYGLLASLLASRPPLFQLGFQYSLTTVACAVVGMLMALAPRSPRFQRWSLLAAGLLAVVVTVQWGMIFPRDNFMGGFRRVDFEFSDEDRRRYREAMEIAALIPDDASVTASETLVPHVARRAEVQTVRFAHTGPGRYFDYYFFFEETARADLRFLFEVSGQRDYELVARNATCGLLRRRPAAGAPGSANRVRPTIRTDPQGDSSS
jgi:uncharacterized membrane protein